MSHTIYVGKVSKKKNSTYQPTLSVSFDVLLKTPTSLHTPTFTISADSFDYNYLKWGDRYYFVTDVVSRNNNLWEVTAIVDVLATFKDDILASTQYVCYSSEKTSDWLADTRIPLLQSTQTSVSTSLTGILSTIGCYILTVVGVNSCTSYAIQSEATLSQIMADLQTWEDNLKLLANSKIVTQAPSYQTISPSDPSSDDRDECFKALTHTISNALNAMTTTAAQVQDSMNTVLSTVENAAVETGFTGNAYANAPQCIRSCIWVPFDYALAPSSGASSAIYLGTYNTGKTGDAITGKPVTGSNTISIPWHYSDWRRAICEDVYLYLPLVGMVQLSGDSLTHVSSLTIEWSATYTDGVITYKVKAGNDVIGSYGGQCASNYPLGLAQQASAGEVVQSIIGGAEKVVGAIINSSISPLSMGGAVAGIASEAIIGAYNVENVKKSTHISCIGGVGGGAGIGLGRDCVCYTVAHPTVVAPADMVATMGFPTMKPMSLATLTGYCQCANAHISAAGEAQELNELDAYVNGGFYIE